MTGGKRPGAFLELFRNGQDHGIKKLYYAYQTGSGGIADALKLAEPFAEKKPCVVILGDNYFESGIAPALKTWSKQFKCQGAACLLKHTDTPWAFGIAEVGDEGKILSIEEKPKKPKSNMAILGCYFFDAEVWNMLPNLQASGRGELEITDVLRFYMTDDRLVSFAYDDYWSDMGTFDNWMTVSQRVASKG